MAKQKTPQTAQATVTPPAVSPIVKDQSNSSAQEELKGGGQESGTPVLDAAGGGGDAPQASGGKMVTKGTIIKALQNPKNENEWGLTINRGRAHGITKENLPIGVVVDKDHAKGHIIPRGLGAGQAKARVWTELSGALEGREVTFIQGKGFGEKDMPLIPDDGSITEVKPNEDRGRKGPESD